MNPDIRRLLIVWAALSALTVTTMISGGATSPARVGALGLAVVLAAAVIKVVLVLAHYLDLRQAPGWLSGFRLATLVLAAALYGLALIG
ncbi:MAG: cytochrome C oxidase subunit IV family protein [Hyphomicrobiaceae bacterium]|nr:cytochrome C oxidase subunit IV family protein [Hyphomicrobiaceae bacterium]